MAKLPRIPSEWKDQSTGSPQEPSLPRPDLNNRSGGLLDGWQQPGWSLENSGLGLLLHPQIIAQIDFGDKRGQTGTVAPAVSSSTPSDGLAQDEHGNVMVEQVEVTPRVNTQRLAQILSIGEGNYESYNTGTRGARGGRVGHSYLNPSPGTVTGRTINQILNTESRPGTDPNRMFAVGAYQMIIPTLQGAVRALKLTGEEQLTPQMQDRIFSEFLIPKAGDGALGRLLNRGEGTVDQAQNAAAREWASVAVPAGYPTKERGISDGTMSYYPPPANRVSMEATQALREFLTDLTR